MHKSCGIHKGVRGVLLESHSQQLVCVDKQKVRTLLRLVDYKQKLFDSFIGSYPCNYLEIYVYVFYVI